jgi:hypothetical protein
VAADRPLLEVERYSAGSHLFPVSSKELSKTVLAGFYLKPRSIAAFLFLAISAELLILFHGA